MLLFLTALTILINCLYFIVYIFGCLTVQLFIKSNVMTLFILFLSSHVKHYTFFYAHNVNTQQKVMSDFPGKIVEFPRAPFF